jgi:hypothetical protein
MYFDRAQLEDAAPHIAGPELQLATTVASGWEVWLVGIPGLFDMKTGTRNLVPRLVGSWIRKRSHGIIIKPYVGFLE